MTAAISSGLPLRLSGISEALSTALIHRLSLSRVTSGDNSDLPLNSTGLEISLRATA